jgi:hypothetical protein
MRGGNAVATLNQPIGTMADRMKTADGEARPFNKRRSTRVMIDFPVTVFGQSPDGKIFCEKTRTTTVNAHGALVVLETEIAPLKTALLANTKTGNEVQCRIIYRKEIANGRFEIGLEFANPYPRFWGMNFPPEDWNPAERKKVTSPHKPIHASTKGAPMVGLGCYTPRRLSPTNATS